MIRLELVLVALLAVLVVSAALAFAVPSVHLCPPDCVIT